MPSPSPRDEAFDDAIDFLERSSQYGHITVHDFQRARGALNEIRSPLTSADTSETVERCVP